MTLFKVGGLNAVSVLVKLFVLLGLNKFIAIYIGPAGYAVIGQYQNLIQIVSNISGSCINNGVTKFTAEYSNDELRMAGMLRTALLIILVATFVSANTLFFARHYISNLVFGSKLNSWCFGVLAITTLSFGLNSLMSAFFVGRKNIFAFTSTSIVSSIVGAAVTAWLITIRGLDGALLGVAVHPTISFFIVYLVSIKNRWIDPRMFFGKPVAWAAFGLFKFIGMAAISSICSPLAQIFIRDNIVRQFGTQSASMWEAMSRLSAAYLLIVTSSLSVYYLPRFSEIQDGKKIKDEIWVGYKTIIPIASLFGFIVFVLRDQIVKIVFSVEFFPMRDLFLPQICGDLIKIASWLISYVMLGRGMAKLFIVTEILFSIIIVLLSDFLSKSLGLIGVIYAYVIAYIFYLIAMYFFVLLQINRQDH
jgi:PST family polysaccharide transporter